MYAFTSRKIGEAIIILHVEDTQSVIDIVTSHDLKLITYNRIDERIKREATWPLFLFNLLFYSQKQRTVEKICHCNFQTITNFLNG